MWVGVGWCRLVVRGRCRKKVEGWFGLMWNGVVLVWVSVGRWLEGGVGIR